MQFAGLLKVSLLTTDTLQHTLLSAPGVGWSYLLHYMNVYAASPGLQTQYLVANGAVYIDSFIYPYSMSHLYNGLVAGDNSPIVITPNSSVGAQWTLAYDVMPTPLA